MSHTPSVAKIASSAFYYNEFDPHAAQWIRNLIAAGHLPAGEVDERSIVDVSPADLAGFRQCHFFAGIGGWPLALRLAGWPDEREIWTGSCPCQPFSAAGKGAGFADERHLWPAFYHLISQCKPPVVLGEQVASKAVDDWIDLVHADLEAVGYAFGSVPFPSASVGAPHIRDRNYWVADASGTRTGRHTGAAFGPEAGVRRARNPNGCELGDASITGGAVRGLANTYRGQQQGFAILRGDECDGTDARRAQGGRGAAACGQLVGLAESTSSGRREERSHDGRGAFGDRSQGLAAGLVDGGGDHGPSPLHGFWRAADWLLCRDGRWRPVSPSPQLGRLRGYGNAIVPQQAAEFVRAVMDCMP